MNVFPSALSVDSVPGGVRIHAALCRMLYDDECSKEVPATSDGRRIPTVHSRDPVARIFEAPAGYCGDHPQHNRNELPDEVLEDLRLGQMVTDDEFLWKNHSELKYTACELHVKAQRVQTKWTQMLAAIDPPLHMLSPEERKKRWQKVVTDFNKICKSTGVRGMSVCSQLSYFR